MRVHVAGIGVQEHRNTHELVAIDQYRIEHRIARGQESSYSLSSSLRKLSLVTLGRSRRCDGHGKGLCGGTESFNTRFKQTA
jgi:hypothetical protein